MYLRHNILAVSFFILSFINISTSSLSGKSIRENEQCTIALNTGEIIDLSPLFDASQPMILPSTTSLYIYHPCTDVPLHSLDTNNSCQKGYGLCYFVPNTPTDKPIKFEDVILKQIIGKFSLLAVNNEGVSRINRMMEPEIVYKHSQDSEVITTYVRLKCDEKVEKYILTSGKSTSTEHVLTLASKQCCLPRTHYMSGWAVFFIILLVFMAIYFIGGILVLKFIRGANGVEMIPNHEFWGKLPEIAKNGVTYLASCGKNTSDSYEKI